MPKFPGTERIHAARLAQVRKIGLRCWSLISLIFLGLAACHDTSTYGIGTACSDATPCRSPLVCHSGYCALGSQEGGSAGGNSPSLQASGGGSTQIPPIGGATSAFAGTAGIWTTSGGLPTSGGTTSNNKTSGGTLPFDTTTGGASTGGQNAGGTSTGGQNTGGTSTGGVNTGGSSSSPPPPRDIGASCATNSDCPSTHCVDKVCCDSICDGQCETCNSQNDLGHCASLSSGQPVGGRAQCNNAGSTCGGRCQGSMNCTYPDASTPCDNRTGCIDSTQRREGTACDGTGSCSTPITRTCGPPDVCNINTDNNCGKAIYVQADVSEQHTCAVVSDGSLRCWGSNYWGQLGLDGQGIRPAPTPVPKQQFVLSVATGWGHTCALHRDGQVDCWGTDANGDVGCPNPLMLTSPQKCTPLDPSLGAVEIAAGGEHSCARLGSGKIKCWGLNAFGEIGNGTLPTPGTVDSNAYTPVDVSDITDARHIASGVWYVCAVLSSGALECWGDNGAGNLGTGDRTGHAFPTPVVGIDGGLSGYAVAVAGTGEHTCVLLGDGSIRCFGSNTDGQLGDNTTIDSLSPIPAQSPMTATALAVGGQLSCTLTSAGIIQCWGRNNYGQLGDGSNVASQAPVTVLLPFAANFSTLVSKYYHSCALSTDGRLWCWGDNRYGQLGNGTVGGGNIPVEARAPGGQ